MSKAHVKMSKERQKSCKKQEDKNNAWKLISLQWLQAQNLLILQHVYHMSLINLTIKYDVAFVWLLSSLVKCQFRPLTLTLPAHMAQVVVALQLNWTQN